MTATDSERVFTRDQVWQDPNLVVLDSTVYDIAQFAEHHPGGRGPLLASGGTDVTALFHSMHRRAENDLERYKRVLSQFKIGKVVTEDGAQKTPLKMNFNSDFAMDLYSGVCAVLPPNKWWANDAFWLRTWIILFGTLFAEAWYIATGRWEACFLTGLLHAQIGLAVQHDASHGAVSRDWRINAILAYGADWIGNTRWLWFQQHIIGHHPNTNDEVRDPDARSAEPFIFFRQAKEPIRSAVHKFQHWFMYPVLSLYGPSVVYNVPELMTLNHGDEIPVKSNKFLHRQWIPSVLFRIFYWTRTIVLPIYIGGAPLLLGLFGVNFVAGFCLTFVFVLSHNFVGSNRFPESTYSDWYKMQVETSCTYGGRISGLFTGGLNMQIEHHLFPRMCSIHYPTIMPIVKRVCAKHGVNYTYFPSIVDNMLSTIEYMRQNGVNNLHMD